MLIILIGNIRSVTSDYSLTQQKKNPSIKREKSEILKNIHRHTIAVVKI